MVEQICISLQDDIVNEVTAEHLAIWPSTLAKYEHVCFYMATECGPIFH